MYQQALYTLLYAVLSVSSSENATCSEYSNTKESEGGRYYMYQVCLGAEATDLNSSRQFCKENFGGFDVVTFPNVAEYNFIIDKGFEVTGSRASRFAVGFYQVSDGDRFNPETGDYFWINEPNKITEESSTYWAPFYDLIANFSSLPLTSQQLGTFSLDLNGQWFAGRLLTGGKVLYPLTDGMVVCSKLAHVTTTTTVAIATTSRGKTEEFEAKKSKGTGSTAVAVTIPIVIIALAAIPTVYFVIKRVRNSSAAADSSAGSPQHNL